MREDGWEFSLLFPQLFCQPKIFQIRRVVKIFKRTKNCIQTKFSEPWAHVPPTLEWAERGDGNHVGRAVSQAGAPSLGPENQGPRTDGAGLGPLLWIQEGPSTLERQDSAWGMGGGAKASGRRQCPGT